MSVLVSMPLKDGTQVIVETPDDLAPAGVVLAARPGEVVKQVGQTLEEALDSTLVPVARAVVDRLQEIAPQEVQVKLGLTFSAEAGVIISKVSGEASLEVTLMWRRDGKR